MLQNAKRIYALQGWTVEKRAKGWYLFRTYGETPSPRVPTAARSASASWSLASCSRNSSAATSPIRSIEARALPSAGLAFLPRSPVPSVTRILGCR